MTAVCLYQAKMSEDYEPWTASLETPESPWMAIATAVIGFGFEVVLGRSARSCRSRIRKTSMARNEPAKSLRWRRRQGRAGRPGAWRRGVDAAVPCERGTSEHGSASETIRAAAKVSSPSKFVEVFARGALRSGEAMDGRSCFCEPRKASVSSGGFALVFVCHSVDVT